MIKLAVAMLPILALPAQAEELSPWFGSAETGAFQLPQAVVQPQAGPLAPAAACEAGICPDRRGIAIETKDLAAAP